MEKMDDNENDETDMADKEGEKKSTKGSDEEEDNLEDEDNGDEEEMEEVIDFKHDDYIKLIIIERF